MRTQQPGEQRARRSLSVKKSSAWIRQGRSLRPIASAPTSAARFKSGDM